MSSWSWRYLSKCQNHEEDCAHFCCLLRKEELYCSNVYTVVLVLGETGSRMKAILPKYEFSFLCALLPVKFIDLDFPWGPPSFSTLVLIGSKHYHFNGIPSNAHLTRALFFPPATMCRNNFWKCLAFENGLAEFIHKLRSFLSAYNWAPQIKTGAINQGGLLAWMCH